MINIINGASDKPVTSQTLKDWISENTDAEGTLYIGYPIIGTVDGAYEIDALMISKSNGIIAFNLIEGASLPEDYESIQDECHNMLEAKLKQFKELTLRRDLLVDITIVTFAPVVNSSAYNATDGYLIINDKHQLSELIAESSWKHPELYPNVVSVIQAVSKVKVSKNRDYVQKSDSKGAILIKLDQSITNLDNQQSKAVLETVNGVQRIRGLAGSGKTIVLARKIAYLHAKNKSWNIAVTFNSRSLKEQFKRLITSFVFEQTGDIPDWNKIKIIHAWGSSKSEGVYYNACINNNVEYYDFGTAKDQVGANKAFQYVCSEFLKNAEQIIPSYDFMLVDEAQDFSIEFLKLCYLLLDDNKRLVYAYDELQTLTESSMPSAEVIWGENSNGKPLVSLASDPGQPQRDIILDKCYRNPRPVLVSAHALGFGIYREIGVDFDPIRGQRYARQLVQMFDYAPLWEDIGYEVLDGELKEGQSVTLGRKRDASPEFLESHSPIEDVIQFHTFENDTAQVEALVDAIEKNIKEDELKPDDIMVIHSNPLNTRTAVAKARELLYKRNIFSTLAGISGSPDEFYEDNCVMFTSIYRAKGNEAAMVYVINAQTCAEGSGLGTKRNILFTAMTRTKAWLRVFGIGPLMDSIKNEFEQVKDNDFTLSFTYPTDEERKYLRVVNRDMTTQEKNKISKRSHQLDEVASDLLAGEIHKEDLSPELLDKLRKALGL
ncbi:DEAD/DEAH box helicase [Pantoea agglomerans]|uniref:DEAD/DEAH box helicase n=1 Tax=Enterobacter agglomerans TaxID=549 RepID=UPI003C79D4D5